MKLPTSSYLCRYESSIVQLIRPRCAYFVTPKSLLGHVLCPLFVGDTTLCLGFLHNQQLVIQQLLFYTAVHIYVRIYKCTWTTLKEKYISLSIILFCVCTYSKKFTSNIFYNFQWMHDRHSHKCQKQTQKFSQLQNIILSWLERDSKRPPVSGPYDVGWWRTGSKEKHMCYLCKIGVH